MEGMKDRLEVGTYGRKAGMEGIEGRDERKKQKGGM
jgi:hypothetical protein